MLVVPIRGFLEFLDRMLYRLQPDLFHHVIGFHHQSLNRHHLDFLLAILFCIGYTGFKRGRRLPAAPADLFFRFVGSLLDFCRPNRDRKIRSANQG